MYLRSVTFPPSRAISCLSFFIWLWRKRKRIRSLADCKSTSNEFGYYVMIGMNRVRFLMLKESEQIKNHRKRKRWAEAVPLRILFLLLSSALIKRIKWTIKRSRDKFNDSLYRLFFVSEARARMIREFQSCGMYKWFFPLLRLANETFVVRLIDFVASWS